VCTVSPVTAIIIKARNTITAYSVPDFRNWPQAGRGEDEGDDDVSKCNRLTDFLPSSESFSTKLQAKLTDRYANV